jgi:hypothetical protein
MHACVGVCVLMHKAHAHGDCCEAMHACACFVCAHEYSVCAQSFLRGGACMCVSVCLNRLYAHCYSCEAMHYIPKAVCMNKAYLHFILRFMLTVTMNA